MPHRRPTSTITRDNPSKRLLIFRRESLINRGRRKREMPTSAFLSSVSLVEFSATRSPSNPTGAAMPIRRLSLLLLMTALCVGCIRIEEEITLDQDGAGQVQMVVSFPELGMRWLPGKPDIDWLRPHLPGNVEITSFENSKGTTAITGADGKEQKLVSEVYEMNLAFDDVTALNNIRVRPDARNEMAAAAGGTPGQVSAVNLSDEFDPPPNAGPFQKITLKRGNKTLHFHRLIQAARPTDEVEASMMSTPGSGARPQAYDLGKSTWTISITSPGEVLEHNADKVEGRKLTWEFNLQKLQQQQDRDWTVEFTCRREDAK